MRLLRGRRSLRSSAVGVRRGDSSRRPRGLARSVLIFGLLLAGFYAIMSRWDAEVYAFQGYLRVLSSITGTILRATDQDVEVAGTVLRSPDFTMGIAGGCAGLEAIATFSFAVIASPLAARSRVIGLVLGVVLLSTINLLRIVTIFLVGAWRPSLFAFVHEDLWQAAMILIAVLLWCAWIDWAVKISRRGCGAAG